MKFNPITRRLFTDEGAPLKRLVCPRAKTWDRLRPDAAAGGRHCDACARTVLDTAPFTDAALAARLAAEPDACLKVELDQPNIEVIIDEASTDRAEQAQECGRSARDQDRARRARNQ